MTTIKAIAKAYSVATARNFIQLADFIKGLSKEEKALCKGKTSQIREELERLAVHKKLKSKAEKLKISIKKFKEIECKARIIANHYSGCTGYSMGDVISVSVKYTYRKNGEVRENQLLLAVKSCCKTYAKSCSYTGSERHGSIDIVMDMAEIQSAIFIGGMLSILQGSGKIQKCRFFYVDGQKQHLKANWIDGFITSGHHADTYEACVSWRQGRKEVLVELRRREQIAKLTTKEKEILLERAKSRFVGFQHSIDAGNCSTGTMSFAQRHNLNPKYGYNLGYILSLEDTSYTRRLQNLFV